MKYWFIFIISALLSSLSFAVNSDETPLQLISTAKFKSSLGSNYEAVSLPHHSQGKQLTQGHYQFTINGVNNDSVYAVLIPKLIMAAHIRLNGVELLKPEQANKALPQQWNTPLRVYLPHSALLEKNVLEIDTLSDTGATMLGPIYIGPKNTIETMYQERLFWQQTINKYLFVVSLCTAIFSLLLWLHQRQRVDFLYFAIAAACWCFYSLNIIAVDIPITSKVWWWAIQSSFDFWAIALVFYSHRVINVSYPRFEQALISFGIGASAVYFSSSLTNFSITTNSLHLISISLLLYIAIRHLRECIKPNSIESRILVLACLFMALFSLHDLYLKSPYSLVSIFSDSHYRWQQSIHLAPITQALFVALTLWLQVKRFTYLASDIENLQKNLERNIHKTTQIYHREQLEIQSLHLTSAANNQRQQVYQSLYEDLADKLSAIYHTAKDEKQADAAKAAIAELRDTAQSHQNDSHVLNNELATIRVELDSRCEQAQLSLHWESLVEIPALTIANSLALTLKRILREGLSNIIKHANATQVFITINLSTNQSLLIIRLADNGAGLSNDAQEGRGMANMRKRAADLGGSLECSSHASGGLMLKLSLPCKNY